MAATVRSLTSPAMAPLYSPTQARSDWIAWRSACAIALAVSAGVCKAGRIGTVATGFGLAPAVDGAVICALTGAPAAMNINVAVSIDLMTSLRSIEARATKHICLVGDSRRRVQQNDGNSRHCEERSEEAIHWRRLAALRMDCFAALAMTAGP